MCIEIVKLKSPDNMAVKHPKVTNKKLRDKTGLPLLKLLVSKFS